MSEVVAATGRPTLEVEKVLAEVRREAEAWRRECDRELFEGRKGDQSRMIRGPSKNAEFWAALERRSAEAKAQRLMREMYNSPLQRRIRWSTIAIAVLFVMYAIYINVPQTRNANPPTPSLQGR